MAWQSADLPFVCRACGLCTGAWQVTLGKDKDSGLTLLDKSGDALIESWCGCTLLTRTHRTHWTHTKVSADRTK